MNGGHKTDRGPGLTTEARLALEEVKLMGAGEGAQNVTQTTPPHPNHEVHEVRARGAVWSEPMKRRKTKPFIKSCLAWLCIANM